MEGETNIQVCCGPPKELLPQMRNLIASKTGFWLTVTGSSMNPTLRHLSDSVFICSLEERAKRGDIVLIALNEEHCLLHRVVKCDDDKLYLKGDALCSREGPFLETNVIGIVALVERGGRVIKVNRGVRLASLIFRELWCLWRNCKHLIKTCLLRYT